ncbi:polyprenol monophosphomannose synthase [Conexibacter woesei]|uniref:Dolichyl-phosphate beta-D-mannosyltransferase n=1 Tax=Conexibacter woesei (strain DSM 14684 / CCUG 47730 / CIP 108061 / JCM 11494 / NBRC 100937 / ID131577) TaxID=469383 RepID=D3F0E9_CONWI|nr:polyprenol monophosphomannose synthase [Conexibacter woesei]ADB52009.1 Dolichyl-phosphate beta-D-mannosyltransferase [Conexibacter woesei DSM 14684]
MTPSTWVIVPTYNEAGSIERMLRQTAQQLADAAPGDHRLLVVDDGSPDGTGAIAERIGDELGVVEVLHRSAKGGLGQAYLAGFAHALAGGAQRVCEMDADLSHDPEHLPALLRAAESADVVLGSRYVPGGGVSDWGPLRRLTSRAGCLYARLVLRLPQHDLTGGYKVIRREVLEAIELGSVRSQGYVFQIEITYRAVLAGFRVAEVPIVFRDRTEGTSKMSPRIALEAMWRVPQLRRSAPAALARIASRPAR